MNNVVQLAPVTVDLTTIERLKSMLADAESGKLTGFAAVTVMSEGTYDRMVVGTSAYADGLRLLGEVARLEHLLHKLLDRG